MNAKLKLLKVNLNKTIDTLIVEMKTKISKNVD